MNCTELLTKIQSGEDGVREAIRDMYTNEVYQKIAFRLYNKYPNLRKLLNWEDLLTESIIRFTDKVLSGSRIRNCNPYFYGICNNYCKELARKSNGESSRQIDSDKTDELFRAVKPYIDKLSPQCRLLLSLLYFHHPPWDPKEREKLAEILNMNGYNVQPHVVSALISRCKRKLKELIGKDLDDFDL